MKRLGVLAAAGVLLAAAPSFSQTVGTCPRGGGGNQPAPARVLFDLGSAQIRPDNKPVIAQAVAAQMIRDGVPANHLYIVADPEAFGNMSLGKEDASVIDRKVTIFFSR